MDEIDRDALKWSIIGLAGVALLVAIILIPAMWKGIDTMECRELPGSECVACEDGFDEFVRCPGVIDAK